MTRRNPLSWHASVMFNIKMLILEIQLILDGYGSHLFGLLRVIDQRSLSPSEFPLILGRDFSGIVRDTGRAVYSFAPGDEVSWYFYLNLNLVNWIGYGRRRLI